MWGLDRTVFQKTDSNRWIAPWRPQPRAKPELNHNKLEMQGATPSTSATENAAPSTMAEQLAAFVVKARFEDISPDAKQQLKAHTLDAIGCAIGALEGPPLKAVRSQVIEFGGRPLTSLIGGGKSAPDLTALYNSFLERYLDFMDSFIAKHGPPHPADNVMSVLAATEYTGGSDNSSQRLLSLTRCNAGASTVARRGRRDLIIPFKEPTLSPPELLRR